MKIHMNEVINLGKKIQKIKGKECKYFAYIERSYEESVFDTDNSKTIYFDIKFKSWFSFNFCENVGDI